MQFLPIKNIFFLLYFFLVLVIKTLDPYPDTDSMNPDPQHCFFCENVKSLGRYSFTIKDVRLFELWITAAAFKFFDKMVSMAELVMPNRVTPSF